MTTTEPDPGGCPFCKSTSVQRAESTPTVGAWCCTACGTQWAITVVNPRRDPFLQQLAEEVARSVLREVDALLEEAPGMSDGVLRVRLITVLAALDQHVKNWPS